MPSPVWKLVIIFCLFLRSCRWNVETLSPSIKITMESHKFASWNVARPRVLWMTSTIELVRDAVDLPIISATPIDIGVIEGLGNYSFVPFKSISLLALLVNRRSTDEKQSCPMTFLHNKVTVKGNVFRPRFTSKMECQLTCLNYKSIIRIKIFWK